MGGPARAGSDSAGALVPAVTGVGIVSSIGLGAASTCAALRAGISRPSSYRGLSVLDADTLEDEPVTGHPIAGFTDGFHLVGRWVRLARGALDDLFPAGARAPDARFWERSAVLLATREPDDDLFQVEPGEALDRMRREYWATMRSVLHCPDGCVVELVPRGHTSTAAALARAVALLGSGLERALVIAVDSWFHPVLVQRLVDDDRLKTSENPVGLAPGEAGVALLLETGHAARSRQAAPLGFVRAAALASEPPSGDEDRPSSGRGLEEAVLSALQADDPASPFDGELVADLNGENWRAMQWGMARVRLGGRIGGARLHLPATSLGDTGAASGAVGVALALHLMARVRRVPRALVVSSSEHHEAACVALRAATGAGR
jgi:3-oxoacyl-[acyl-carrier-protein] synthase-1